MAGAPEHVGVPVILTFERPARICMSFYSAARKFEKLVGENVQSELGCPDLLKQSLIFL